MKGWPLLGCRGLFVLPLFCFLFLNVSAFPQKSDLDYNTYYRFPFALGVEYQNLSPFTAYRFQYSIFDLSAILRWPIPKLPVLQPTLKAGMMRFDSQDASDPLKWDHTHWYGALGLEAAHRFARNFELGAEALCGATQAVFPRLLPEQGTLGTFNLFFETGGRIALNPSYNFSIDVHPNLKYLMSLSPLKDFDGFIFGIGFAATYRFGQDPDAPAAVIRSIRFERTSIPPLFAAMQSYYARHPVGTVTITNVEKHAVTDLTVSFYQAGYMDSPTPAASIPMLKAGESRDIELFASFNQEVFKTEGVTPLTGEVIVAYQSKGRPVEQRQSVSYDLHDKTAISWDDDRKAAAFITPADSALRNYASFIRQACKQEIIPGYNEPLQTAMQIFHALAEIGCLYQADPILPFSKAQGQPIAVDSISLPRDTLKRISGDCDDLTVLYCSLLETAGIETGFITVPGHIYAAFNTKAAGREYRSLHADRAMTLNLNDELWIPVEITLIGRTGFQEAWRRGAEEWIAYEGDPSKRCFYKTRQCQELYRPVGLKETDLGLQYGSKEAIVERFRKERDRQIERVIQDYASEAQASGRKEDWNRLGIVCAQFQRYGPAEQAFRKAQTLDPAYINARINLGNLLFLRQRYNEALAAYLEAQEMLKQKAAGSDGVMAKLLINLSRAYYQLERFGEAKNCYNQASAIDPEKTKEYAYLAEIKPETARAAGREEPGGRILFIEE